MYDLAIIGGGPAAVSAGVYASRKQLKTVFITKDFGGQSKVSDSIENWIGTKSISGIDLAKDLEEHLKFYAEDIVDIQEGEYADKVEKIDRGFKVTTDKGSYEAKAVFIGTGSHRRKLEIPGAEEFDAKGIVYCASCDGPLFTGKDVVVIGGGNAGFETAAQLLAYAKSVTLLHRGPEYKADPVTVDVVLKDPKMTGITNANITEVFGENFVKGIKYTDESGEEKTLNVEGVFVEIGNVPTTGMLKDVIELDEFNRIEIDPWTQQTKTEGIWAAGDCTNIRYHQNNIAAGDAVKALEDIYLWIKKQK
jgi:alkyl hydroperoxide reductase subunit F